jgi:hypothetical protein
MESIEAVFSTPDSPRLKRLLGPSMGVGGRHLSGESGATEDSWRVLRRPSTLIYRAICGVFIDGVVLPNMVLAFEVH